MWSKWKRKLPSGSNPAGERPLFLLERRPCVAQTHAMASDADAEGVPAVVFTAPATVIVGGSLAPLWPLSGRRGARLGVEVIVLVEVSVVHEAEAGGGAQVLTAAFVLLDGLMKRPELTQKRHVLLTETHLWKGEGGSLVFILSLASLVVMHRSPLFGPITKKS